ncbi:hypothetical protein [Tenacibaculum sp. nBUS_03]|uniref:hypothetical protein n=1 Tax=Tenacibaculum sp. nBUS_03 TaxID=3395320 RepID=UPI003EBD7FDC
MKINDVKGSKTFLIQEEYKNFFHANQNKENFKSIQYNKLKSFIEENKNHPLSGKNLGELALVQPILTKNEFIELYT